MVEVWVVRHGFLRARRADALTARQLPDGRWRVTALSACGYAVGATPEAALWLWANVAGWRCISVTPLARRGGVVR